MNLNLNFLCLYSKGLIEIPPAFLSVGFIFYLIFQAETFGYEHRFLTCQVFRQHFNTELRELQLKTYLIFFLF